MFDRLPFEEWVDDQIISMEYMCGSWLLENVTYLWYHSLAFWFNVYSRCMFLFAGRDFGEIPI